MSNANTDELYNKARESLNDALKEVHEAGVDITSPTFQAVFKQQTLDLYSRILDDPETYKI